MVICALLSAVTQGRTALRGVGVGACAPGVPAVSRGQVVRPQGCVASPPASGSGCPRPQQGISSVPFGGDTAVLPRALL